MTMQQLHHTREGRFHSGRKSGGGMSPKFRGLPVKQASVPRLAASTVPPRESLLPIPAELSRCGQVTMVTVVLTCNGPIERLVNEVVMRADGKVGCIVAFEEGFTWVLEFVCRRVDQLKDLLLAVGQACGLRTCHACVKA